MSEFSIIRNITRAASAACGQNNRLLVPPGDDAALLSAIQRPVISTDTQRQGVHFDLAWQSPEAIGYKAVMTALSDLAASYATPIACFINLALPTGLPEALPEQIYQGINRALTAYDCCLGGGNLSSAGELSLDLFVIGEGSPLFPKRSNAKPGDTLYASGQTGHAGAGLSLLQAGAYGYSELKQAFIAPEPGFEAAGILQSAGVTCVMDISDGLGGDAGHIAKASNITIEFHIDEDLIDPVLKNYCRQYRKDLITQVLTGGEDYKLLFACNEQVYQKEIKPRLPASVPVGKCLPFTGSYLTNIPDNITFFQHHNASQPPHDNDPEGRRLDETF